jgi:23S rRNA (guanosine2251-2'-O)-methyltransferase
VLPDGIEDPFNLGYTLRSLYAAGVDGVVMPIQNRLCAAGTVAKSSAGTSELLDIRVSDTESAIKAFIDHGYKVVCAGIRDSVSIYEADLKKPLLLVVGGEKRGISRNVLDLADQIVRIDYGRSFNGSLSAASATTVIAFEVLHQNIQ